MANDDQLDFSFGESPLTGQDQARLVPCRHCSKPAPVPQWYGDKELDLHFCSTQCRREWTVAAPDFSVRLAGRNSGHRGANWSIQARAARRRDAYRCQRCGISEAELGRRLDVHHKVPYSSFKSNLEANRLDNLISVCPACHGREEAQLRRDLPLFRRP